MYYTCENCNTLKSFAALKNDAHDFVQNGHEGTEFERSRRKAINNWKRYEVAIKTEDLVKQMKKNMLKNRSITQPKLLTAASNSPSSRDVILR